MIDRKQKLEMLVEGIRPQFVNEHDFKPGSVCLVIATAPISQIRDYSIRMQEIYPGCNLSFLASKSRAAEILQNMRVEPGRVFAVQEDGPITDEKLINSGLHLVIRKFESYVVLINNIAGMGYENVVSALFGCGVDRLYLRNIKNQFLYWDTRRWEFAVENLQELKRLFDEVWGELI